MIETTIMSKDGHKVVQLNRRRAIREKCLNCRGWDSTDVKECADDFEEKCPLHPFRMAKGKQDAKKRNQAIKDCCKWCVEVTKEISKCPLETCPLYCFRKGHS